MPLNPSMMKPAVRKNVIKIGRPGYKVTKIRDPFTLQIGLLFQIHYPQIAVDIKPRHRFMSAYEQRVETPNKAYQYLIFSSEPYENIAFKVLFFFFFLKIRCKQGVSFVML
jgi:splicing factor 3A subunit 2